MDVHELAFALTDPFSEEVEKVRAIFSWIAEHIDYDCRLLVRRKPTRFSYGVRKSIIKRWLKFGKSRWRQTLSRRKGICDDYSTLFKQPLPGRWPGSCVHRRGMPGNMPIR